jgi:aspartyl-tRNA(Asn)/glutamyl-tRNA(Gln) amidotransferase subunit A
MNDLHLLTISQAHQLLKEKKISAVELTKASLAYLAKMEDKVQACVTISEDVALEQAKEADKAISSGKIKPLTGIPVMR